MKKLLFPIFAILVLAMIPSCGSDAEKTTADTLKKDSVAVVEYFGDTITADGAIPASQLVAQLGGKDSVPMKIEGTITACCQKKGCWMRMDVGNNQTVRVSFKDYAFFMPMDCAGKTAVLDGYATVDTTTVAMLRHYAEDAGASKDSIAKITEPEVELSFEARGVILRK